MRWVSLRRAAENFVAPNAKPLTPQTAGLRPADYGLKTIAEDPATLTMWNDALKSAANSPKGNAYKDYLQVLERGGTSSKEQLDGAFKVVNGKFLESYKAAGNKIYAVHHWNFSRNDFPNQVFDSRNLVPVPDYATHKSIHQATSGTTKIWEGPVAPQHQMPISDFQTPLQPRPSGQ